MRKIAFNQSQTVFLYNLFKSNSYISINIRLLLAVGSRKPVYREFLMKYLWICWLAVYGKSVSYVIIVRDSN